MNLLFSFFSLAGLDTLISNITTLDRKFITMQLNKKDTHGKPSLFFTFYGLMLDWDSSIFDKIEVPTVAIFRV